MQICEAAVAYLQLLGTSAFQYRLSVVIKKPHEKFLNR